MNVELVVSMDVELVETPIETPPETPPETPVIHKSHHLFQLLTHRRGKLLPTHCKFTLF